jgi:MoaA/NifB/PqqE/SkfB family radical SAM enzyme
MGILNTNLKVFAYPEKLRSLPADVPEVLPPLHVRIKPTNVCNHDCWFCAYRQDDFQLGETMVEKDQIPLDKMMEIVDDLIEMKVGAATFSGGGEPFVYPHLLRTVQRLADAGIPFASLTNGSRLNGALAEIFAHRGTWVRVSLDGWDGPSYAKARHVKEGEFAKVTGNMEAFKKLGGSCLLSAVIVVGHENGPHVYELSRVLAELGVDSIKISPVVVSNDEAENHHYHLAHHERVREQVARAKADFGHLTEISDAFDLQMASFRKDYHWCPFLQIRPVIAADLNVYSCQDKAYNPDGLLFSIKERRFRDAWLASKEQFLHLDPSKVCNHHCVAHRGNQLVLEYLDMDRQHLPFV